MLAPGKRLHVREVPGRTSVTENPEGNWEARGLVPPGCLVSLGGYLCLLGLYILIYQMSC